MNGYIRQEDIDAVRERSDLVEIVSEHVSLKKKGKLFWGLCPFHREKTPSFKVDPALQLYHCFGCGEGGNVFSFLIKVEHLDFAEAVRALADRVGYQLRVEKKQAKAVSERARLLEANAQAAEFYRRVLTEAAEGKAGRDYLERRGFSQEIVSKFGLGFVPNAWDSLAKSLFRAGFSERELVTAGLVIKGEKGYYDRFRNRVVFPIRDLRGRVVGFGGRVVGDASQGTPKYMNSPETPVYHKSSTLYGIDAARSEITKTGEAFVVEGYTDVLALAQAGIENVAATLGTAFTGEHLALLERLARRATLVFDADSAGLKAAERAGSHLSEFRPPGLENVGDLVENVGVDVRVAVLPPGRDPADFVTESGREGFLEVTGQALPFVEFCLDRIVEQHDISTPLGKSKAAATAIAAIAGLPATIPVEDYMSRLAQRLAVSDQWLYAELGRQRAASKRSRRGGQGGTPPATPDAQVKAEREVLRMLLRRPEFRDTARDLGNEHFVFPLHQRLFLVLKGADAGTRQLELIAEGDQELMSFATGLSLEELPVEEEELYFADILRKLKEFQLQRQINSLKLQLERLNPLKSRERYDALFEELIELEASKRDLRLERRHDRVGAADERA